MREDKNADGQRIPHHTNQNQSWKKINIHPTDHFFKVLQVYVVILSRIPVGKRSRLVRCSQIYVTPVTSNSLLNIGHNLVARGIHAHTSRWDALLRKKVAKCKPFMFPSKMESSPLVQVVDRIRSLSQSNSPGSLLFQANWQQMMQCCQIRHKFVSVIFS